MPTNRYCPPLYMAALEGLPGRALERIPLQGGKFYEDWLQRQLFEHPEILPFREIDPSFAPAIPLCRELPTDAGRIDLAYTSDTGRITLIECKLWRNPEARREVIGQILDYAKELAAWDYDRLSRAVGSAAGRSGDSLYDIAAEQDPNLDQATFVDDVTRNLKEGRFLLAIVGDGIRESVESIATFLQSHAGLRFSFALVEMAVYRMPAEGPEGFIVQPRVLARTVEIERLVVRREDDGIAVEDIAGGGSPGRDDASGPRAGRPRLSLEEIYKQLSSVNPDLAPAVAEFLGSCKDRGIYPSVNRTLVLRYTDDLLGKLNFGSVYPDGLLDTNYICASAEEAGDISVGVDYLAGIAAMVPGAAVLKKGNPWTWRVVAGKSLPRVETVLQRSDDWLALIDKTLARFMELRKRLEEAPD